MSDTPTVPRVARSVDDLRVGQEFAYKNPNEDNGGWCFGKVETLGKRAWETQTGAPLVAWPIVILSDPPPPPVVLSAEAQTALGKLREAVALGARGLVTDAADAFLAAVDAGREGDSDHE